MQVKNNPPKKPSIVLFGDTLSNSFCLPKFFPIAYAKESFTHARTKKPSIIPELKLSKNIGISAIKTKELDR
jgi:hypothetical protein